MAARAYVARFHFLGTDQQKKVGDLSGGERNRLHLAKLLRRGCNVLLLDEPTTFLDIAHQIELLDLLATLNRDNGNTLVAVLHDLNHACRYADHIIAMKDGAVVTEGPPAEIVTADLVEAVFGLPCRIIDDPESHTPLVIPKVAACATRV